MFGALTYETNKLVSRSEACRYSDKKNTDSLIDRANADRTPAMAENLTRIRARLRHKALEPTEAKTQRDDHQTFPCVRQPRRPSVARS